MSFDFQFCRSLCLAVSLLVGLSWHWVEAADTVQTPPKEVPKVASKEDPKAAVKELPKVAPKEVETTAPATPPIEPAVDEDALSHEQKEIAAAAIAKPVSAEPVQVFGWRENVVIQGVPGQLTAKLDTGALTSSLHAENKELFERDGKKWVRFVVTDPTIKGGPKTRIEAPLVRVALIKEPGGESVAREVVKLGFKIGDRTVKAEFTLNNRSNMLAPVLIGRSLIRDLGMVDVRRAYIADQKIFR